MNDRAQQIEERLASQLQRASAVLPIEYDHTTHADLRWLLDERKALVEALHEAADLLAGEGYHTDPDYRDEWATITAPLSASVSVEQAEAYVCSGGDSHLPACGGTCGTFETLEQAGGES